MKKMKRSIVYMLFLVCLINCNGQEKKEDLNNNDNMKQFITQTLSKYYTPYKTRPVYSMQVSKQGCRLIIESYSEDYRFVENGGESMMIPFNYMINKSGEQKVKVKVYPEEGESYITKYAHVVINVYNAADKDTPLNDYKKIETFTLPQGLESQKLPYYEYIITFNAVVPFDYSKDLENATNLTKIPNIEELVKKKFLEIQEISEKNNFKKFVELDSYFIGRYANSTYETLDETVAFFQKYGENTYSITSPQGFDKQFLSLDDCELKFYADGKTVSLWHKKTMTGGLSKNFKYKNKTGEVKESFDDTPITLYMPKGSTELKVW